MLIRFETLKNSTILSVHISGPIAQVKDIIIDPDELKIIALRINNRLPGENSGDILPLSSIREFSRIGIIIDSNDEIMEEDDIIRVKDVLKLNFDLIGLKAVSKKGAKLGKVISYTADSDTGTILQLIVQRPIYKAFVDPELIVPRSAVLEVDDYKITIKDEEKEILASATEEFVPNFVNPFRDREFAQDPIVVDDIEGKKN